MEASRDDSAVGSVMRSSRRLYIYDSVARGTRMTRLPAYMNMLKTRHRMFLHRVIAGEGNGRLDYRGNKCQTRRGIYVPHTAGDAGDSTLPGRGN